MSLFLHPCGTCGAKVSNDAISGYGFCPNCGSQGSAALGRFLGIGSNSSNSSNTITIAPSPSNSPEMRDRLKAMLAPIVSKWSFTLYPCWACQKMIDKNLFGAGYCPSCNSRQDFEDCCAELNTCPRCFFDKGNCVDNEGVYWPISEGCGGSGTRTIVGKVGGIIGFFTGNKSTMEITCPCCHGTGECGRCQGDLLYHPNEEREIKSQNSCYWEDYKETIFIPSGRIPEIRPELIAKNTWQQLSMGPRTTEMLLNIVNHPNFNEKTPFEAFKAIWERVNQRLNEGKMESEHYTMIIDKLKEIHAKM